jgi:hypothetical protein
LNERMVPMTTMNVEWISINRFCSWIMSCGW